jgi:hypothetical protein
VKPPFGSASPPRHSATGEGAGEGYGTVCHSHSVNPLINRTPFWDSLALIPGHLVTGTSYPAAEGLTLALEATRAAVIHRRAWLRGADHAGADDPGRRVAC